MNLIDNRRKIGIKRLLGLIGINILVFGILTIVFFPALKSDDYYLSEICYGAYSGEYDIHLVYNNILLGYVLKGLLLLFPNIAWYAVLQIILLICAFISLSKELYISLGKKGICLWFIVAFFFGYECYIKITFSKTAGFLIAIGFFLIFINCLHRNCYKRVLLGAIYVLWGILYRSSMLEMVVAFFIGILFIEFVIQKKQRVGYKKVLCLGLIICIIFGGNIFLNKNNQYLYSIDANWNDYFYNNSIKAQIIDHSSMDYERNREKFEEIGVSENDLYLVYRNYIYDPECMSIEKQEKIKEIVQKDVTWNKGIREIIKISVFVEYMRNIFKGYLKYSWFICLFFFLGLLLLYKSMKGFLYFAYAILILVAENYYLYLKGRYLQPHVDVSIGVTIVLFCLFYLCTNNELQKSINWKKDVFIVVSIIVIQIMLSYDYFNSEYYLNYGTEQACNPEDSKEIMDVIHSDPEHLYITSDEENVLSLWSFNTYEVIPKGYFSNVFSLGKFRWYSHSKVLDKYGVVNPLKEMVDSDMIYYMVSDINEERECQLYTTYIREHYDSNAQLKKIKEIGTVNIYNCVSEGTKINVSKK